MVKKKIYIYTSSHFISNQGIAKSHKDYIPKMHKHFCQKDEQI